MTHHLTDWMGDDGFLCGSSTRIRRHNPVGDTLYIDGRVTARHEEHGTVEIEHAACNQDGELSIEGTAVVRLPRRGA